MSIAGRVYSQEDIEWRIVAGVEKQAGEPAAAYVHDIIVNVDSLPHSRLATGISVLFLIWGGSAMFLQLQFSINEMWGITPTPGKIRDSLHAMLRSRLLSAGLVVAMGYLVVLALTVSTLDGNDTGALDERSSRVNGRGDAICTRLVIAIRLHGVVCVHFQGVAPGEDTLARRVGRGCVNGVSVLDRQQVHYLLFE